MSQTRGLDIVGIWLPVGIMAVLYAMGTCWMLVVFRRLGMGIPLWFKVTWPIGAIVIAFYVAGAVVVTVS